MQVIGTGVGRTGTTSLRIAIDQLGLGPCHHMDQVIEDIPRHVPLWSAALAGKPDWAAIYNGFASAVDWPTAGFFRELYAAYPSAKFILTHRNPESWADSFCETIYKLLAEDSEIPAEMRDWVKMCSGVVARTGFPQGLDRDALIEKFVGHNNAVRAAIPADQLLVYQVKEGWGPLCDFLGIAAPEEAFPRTNNRQEFWDLVAGNG